VSAIDVEDWEQSAEYGGGLTAEMPLAQWFWRVVRDLDADSLAKLLHFCTGSSRGSVTPPCLLSRTYFFPCFLVHSPGRTVSPGKESVSPVSRVFIFVGQHLAGVIDDAAFDTSSVVTRAVTSWRELGAVLPCLV
jgi:hypothetical protein